MMKSISIRPQPSTISHYVLGIGIICPSVSFFSMLSSNLNAKVQKKHEKQEKALKKRKMFVTLQPNW